MQILYNTSLTDSEFGFHAKYYNRGCLLERRTEISKLPCKYLIYNNIHYYKCTIEPGPGRYAFSEGGQNTGHLGHLGHLARPLPLLTTV